MGGGCGSKFYLPYDTVIPSLGIFPREMRIQVVQDAQSSFIQHSSKLKPRTGEWVTKSDLYSYKDYYSDLKRNYWYTQ